MPLKELYHGTNTKRLDKIKKEGLDPKAVKSSSGEDFVYLTDHPEVAAEFSGFGTDKQGIPHEGYMTPLDGKKKNGVILKVKVDSKWLKPDKIWAEKLKQLKNRDKMIENLKEEIKEDINGNQVLEFRVETEAHKIASKIVKNNPDDFTDDDLDFLISENYDDAADIVAMREATKIVDSQLSELKKFAKGNLFQCAKRIPPEAIIEVIPAKKHLPKSDFGARNFGNNEIEVMGFLVRAAVSRGKLYHFISPEKLRLALDKNAMMPLGSTQPMDMKKKYLQHKNSFDDSSVFVGISTTRNPVWKPRAAETPGEGEGYWADIRITFDGSKISNKYKIVPYNDFWKASDFAKKKRDAKDEFYSQAEEKIITGKGGLKNFLQYVTSIEVLNSAKAEFEKEGLSDLLKNVPVKFVDKFSRA